MEKPKLLKKTDAEAALAALRDAYTVFDLRDEPFLTPKEALLPRSETLFGIDIKTGDITEPDHSNKTVLFGIYPCDARSILNLDCAFLEKGFTDTAYKKRREALTVISMACTEIPYPACFCDSMGGSPDSKEGADIFLHETADSDAWLVSFITDKSKEIETLWQNAGILSDLKNAEAKNTPACVFQIDRPKDLPAKLIAAFEDPAWTRFSEACIGCGTCSYICPTCYCFDIDTEKEGNTAEQLRCWDCCMFSDYSRMAGGHNPRPTKKERLRNRYLHKLAYFDERYGKTLCVGCGRCITKCPAGLDIALIIDWGCML